MPALPDGSPGHDEYPPAYVDGRGRAWYRVDLHVHSALSEGADQEPAQLAAAARAAGLDAMAITDHNSAGAHGRWPAEVTGPLLVILGQEVISGSGHWLAVGIEPARVVEWRYGPGDDAVETHLESVRRAGGLCVAAHPFAPYPGGTFGYPYADFDAVEVWNGLWRSDLPWNADNESALAEWGRSLAAGISSGSWRPAVGNSDAHLEGQLGTPHTVVLADELSVAAVLGSVRAGRCWIAETASVELTLSARSGDRIAGIGESLSADGAPITVTVTVVGVASGQVTLLSERGGVHRAVLPESGSGTVEWVTTAHESAFVRAEVRHSDGRMAAMTNPVILTGTQSADSACQVPSEGFEPPPPRV